MEGCGYIQKLFRKSNIFSFILGAIIFGSIGVVSAYTLYANDIEYTPKDTTWKKEDGSDITNVKEAIDELYNSKKSIFGEAIYNVSNGDQLVNRTASLTLSKGEYLIVSNFSRAYTLDKTVAVSELNGIGISCDSCTKTKLSGKGAYGTAASAISNRYARGEVNTALYYVIVNSDNDTISLSPTLEDATTNIEFVHLHAIPIS